MNGGHEEATMMNLMIKNLEATLVELTNRYNDAPSKAKYAQIRAVRDELARVRRGEL